MLTERQKHILKIVIDDYIRSAEPVGSRSISKRGDIHFSSATIRNEMSDLEEMGYLSQPHTSAGRIPSHKGYRFYVDHLLTPKKLATEDMEKIRHMFEEQYVEFEQVIQQTASMLADLTNYTSIILGNDFFDTTLKHMQLIPITNQTAVVIIVTSTGHVENRKVTVPEGISLAEMERLVHLFNDKLVGVPLIHLRKKLYSEIADELRKHFEHYQQALYLLEQVTLSNKAEKIYLGGTTKIFAQPEFRDIDKVKDIFEWLEQEERIMGMLDIGDQTGVHVRIGQENQDEAVSDCTIITATYALQGRPVGSLSILGPTRMQYRYVISILDHLTNDLSFLLNNLYKKG